MRHSLRWFLLPAILAGPICASWADDGPAAEREEPGIPQPRGVREYTPAETFSDEWFEQTKKPVDWFTWGAQQRIRGIWDKNLMTVDEGAGDERFWQRYRTRLWGTFTPFADEDLDINVGLAWEWRNYCRPKGPIRDTNLDEVIVETLNVKWSNIGGLPLTATIGRQSWINGINKNRWLFLEGTPLDGSRTIYMDAARLTYEFKDIQTTIDGIYVDNAGDPSDRIPPFNDRDKHVIEHDERAGILYVSNSSMKNTQVDGYFVVKHDMGTPSFPASDRTTYTVGARITGFFDDAQQWEYDAQYAQQWGDQKPGQNICAAGALAKMAYYFKDEWKNCLRLGYEYRSGDDPSTGHDESFDVLWGRYPQWSNIYEGYMDTFEGTRPAYAANLHRVGMGWTFAPGGREDMTIKTDYHLLLADQNTYGQGGDPGNDGVRTVTKSGCVRGHLLTGLWEWEINKHVKTHLLGEVLFPGDYYSDAKNEAVMFFRYQIVLSW